MTAFMAELELARGGDPAAERPPRPPARPEPGGQGWESAAWSRTWRSAWGPACWSATGPEPVAHAFCAARLAGGRRAFGTLPTEVDAEPIVERALSDWPPIST